MWGIDGEVVVCSHHITLRLAHAPKVVPTPLQYAAWLGNSSGLIMIAENDIYIRSSPQQEEDTRLTDTGQAGVYYNGVADWLYQGESTVLWVLPVVLNQTP